MHCFWVEKFYNQKWFLGVLQGLKGDDFSLVFQRLKGVRALTGGLNRGSFLMFLLFSQVFLWNFKSDLNFEEEKSFSMKPENFNQKFKSVDYYQLIYKYGENNTRAKHDIKSNIK